MNNMNGMNMNPMGGGMNMNSMGGMNPNMAGSMNPNMGHHGGMMNPSTMHHMPGMANGGMPMNMGMGMGMPGRNGGNGGGNPSAMNPMGMPGMGGHMPSHHGQPHGHHMMGMNGMPQMQQMSHGMNMGMHMGQGGSNAPNMTSSYAMPPSNASYPPPSTAPPSNGQSIANMEWRAQFTREHRTNLIAKMYNEMVRVSTDPPGIALWINVAWFELKLYKECQTQEDYINKILKRLQHLKTQAGDMNPMGHNMMPGHGMPGRDANGMYMQQPPYGQSPGLNINTSNGPSFPNTSGSNSGGPSSANTPKHTQPGANNNNGPNNNIANSNNNNNGPNKGPGGKQPLNPQQQQQQQGGLNQGNKPPHMMPPSQQNQQPNKMGSSNLSPQPNAQSFMAQMAGGPPANTNPAEYWRQHAQLKAKYLADVNTVHNAFRKYVEHMKDQNESEQKKKLTYLLGYVQLCASILSEDASSAPARHLDELEKVNKYVIKIVHPYLKKLKSEKDKRNSASNTPQNQMPPSHNGGGMGGNPQAMSFEMMMRNSMSGAPSAASNGGNNLYQQMMAKNSSMMMDDYGMGMPGSNGGNSYGNQYGANPNMGGGFNMASYGSGMGGNDGNDMMGSNSMDSNLLDFDNGLGMGMADGNSNGNGNGSNSSNDDGGDGDLMNMVEAL